jgi:acyl dehydratase
MSGKFFDEWQVGDRLEHQPHRTVTETDNLLISTLTHNPAAAPPRRGICGRDRVRADRVNGLHLLAAVGLSVGDTTLGTLVANLGYDKVRMPAPVFVGDTLRASTEVLALKESRSRPEAGIVTFKHLMHNQRGELVCEMERTH